MKILVTGTAGFIGFHLANSLLNRGDEVIGLDSINNYYDINVKYGRLNEAGIDKNLIQYGKEIKSKKYKNYTFIQLKLEDKSALDSLFKKHKFDRVVNLAAQAGVRYSIENPYPYIDSNIIGFLNILEACRYNNIQHLVFASTSSVYGLNEQMPFSTSTSVEHPMSLYAATKKSNELMAHTYSHLYSLPTTGLRFFTVYGPWGRPDMALFKFTKAGLENKPIDVFNNGDMLRDFTYIDDIVEGIIRVLDSIPQKNSLWNPKSPDPSSSSAPYKIYNIGNNNPVKLIDFIEGLENALNLKLEKNLLPIQAGDVPKTYANVDDLVENLNYKPNTDYRVGIKKFVNWYKKFFKYE
jgi:UDP-glucuronate 4-epimerase